MSNKSLYTWVAVGGIALASAGAWWFQNGAVKPAGEPAMAGSAGARQGGGGGGPVSVEVAKVKAIALQDDAQAVGSLRSRQSVVLRPEVAGRIAQIGFAEGQRVRKGQLLVQLDDVLQKAELSQAQAQLSIARANLKRNEELVAQAFVAQRVLDESRAALQVAEAQVALAQARLSRMRLTAPFDGTVGLRVVHLGDYVKDGADLVNLEDTSQLTVDFRLPERFQTRIAAGQPVEVGGGELCLKRDDPGGAQSVFQPDAPPDAGLGIAHAQADGDLGPLFLRLENLFGQGPVLRNGHGGEGRTRALRGQRTEAEGPGRAGKAHLIIGRGPDPQGGVRGGQRLDGGRRVPGQTSGASVQTPAGPDRTAGISRRARPRH